MSLATLALILSAGGIAVTGYLAAIFIANPARGMVKVSHELEHLPQVMTDRYVGFTLLALGATLYGDLKVIAFLFAVFAYIALHDAAIYARAGKPVRPHFVAGLAAALVAAVALPAHLNGAA